MCLKTQLCSSSIINVHLCLLTLVLVGGVKSQGGHETILFQEGGEGEGKYLYSTISSPNYPSEFDTPYTKLYAINSSNFLPLFADKNVSLNIYLTELFFEEPWIKIFDPWQDLRRVTLDTKLVPLTMMQGDMAEIQVKLWNFKDQFRTKLHFHEVFGYNISLEVKEEVEGDPVDDGGCSLRNCSFAGRCKSFPGLTGLTFVCECEKDFWGPYCEYSLSCNGNINFCLNGGTCRMLGYAGRECECPPEFEGNKCQLKRKQINFVESQKCSPPVDVNSHVNSDRPCSLCNSISPLKGWHRYLVLLMRNASHDNGKEMLSKVFEDYAPARRLKMGLINYVEVYGRLVENWSLVQGANESIFEADSFLTFYNHTLQPNISMNKENEKPLMEGQEFILTCKSKLPPDIPQHLIQFHWYKDHVPIRREYTTSQRHISQFEQLENSNGREKWAILMIDSVTPFDMGIFTCQVTDLVRNVQECADYSMTVVVPPQIEVLPMSVTMVKNESKILMCSDSLEALNSGGRTELQNLRISWFKERDQEVRANKYISIENIYPQGQILRIKHARESATYTCKAFNKGGERDLSVIVKVLHHSLSPYDYCPKTCEVVETTGTRLVWSLTAIEQTAMINCPEGFSGYAQKRCQLGQERQGSWDKTDFSRCTHEKLGQFNFTLRSMQNGYNVRVDGLSALHKELNKYLDERKGNMSLSFHKLLYGEGDKFITLLVDTFDYVYKLRITFPKVVKDDHATGLVSVVESFIGFRNSCAQESSVNQLLKHFLLFVKEFNIESYQSERIVMIKALLTPTNTTILSPVEIDANTSRVMFDCNGITEEEQVPTERFLTFVKMSGMMHLNENDSFISDIVSVNITNMGAHSCLKEETYFEIQFQTNDTSVRNKTCAGFFQSVWQLNICKINASLVTTIHCFCKFPGTYAVLALKEEPQYEKEVEEKIPFPPEWIATSGCAVCFVLCIKTLLCALMKRLFCPYLLLTSGGMILSSLSLFFIILMSNSREICLLYLLSTLFVQATRIWRMVWVCDMHELYPWLDNVTNWTLLAAITGTATLPLLTVFIFESIFTTQTKSLLDEDSVVFIAFAILFAILVLSIFLLYYKTYLRIHKKKSTSNNNHYGDQRTLNETFVTTVLHMIQVLCVVLYVNLKQHIVFHYTLAIASSILGLALPSPTKVNNSKRRNNQSDETVPNFHPINGTISNSTTITTIPFNDNVRALNNKLELRPLRENPLNRNRKMTSTTVEDTDDERMTIDMSVNNVSTISHSGLSFLKPYKGLMPLKQECQISIDDNYVLPNVQ